MQQTSNPWRIPVTIFVLLLAVGAIVIGVRMSEPKPQPKDETIVAFSDGMKMTMTGTVPYETTKIGGIRVRGPRKFTAKSNTALLYLIRHKEGGPALINGGTMRTEKEFDLKEDDYVTFLPTDATIPMGAKDDD